MNEKDDVPSMETRDNNQGASNLYAVNVFNHWGV